MDNYLKNASQRSDPLRNDMSILWESSLRLKKRRVWKSKKKYCHKSMVLQSGPLPTRRQPEGFMASLFLFIIKILLQVPHQKWPPNFTCVTWWTAQHRPLKESKCLSLRLLWAEQSLLWVLSLTKKAYEPQELQMAGQS